MSFNFSSYNNTFNINIKNKWIKEYKNLNEQLRDEELDLLKLFLVKNYHLNKVYKKYVYKEIVTNNSYYENNLKKIKFYSRDLIKSKSIKNKEIFQKMISSFKLESNKKYELLLKEEKQLKNDLKKYDNKIMDEYEKEIENWINGYNNNTNNSSILLDNVNNIDYDKEEKEIYNIFNLIDNKKEKKVKYRTVDKLKNYKSDYCKIENIKGSNNVNYNLIGNLNLKKNNENIIRLTSSQMSTQFIDFLNDYDDPLEQYINLLLKEINNNNFMSKKEIKKLYGNNNQVNIINDEKNFVKNLEENINKIMEENKNINYYKTKIKNINNIIKDKLGGIYLGWGESEHNEFLTTKNKYKDKSNSFIFLSSLNNIFPYMNIVELKRHIKLYEIYLNLEKIKKILIEKYTQIKNKIDIDKSRISKQTSTSLTKSTSSIKNRRFFPIYPKNKISFDFGNTHKSFYSTKTKFFDVKNKHYKNNEYLRTNYNNNIVNTNKIRKNKEILNRFKNYSSISLNHSRDKISISKYSYNTYKKGGTIKFFNKYDHKK